MIFQKVNQYICMNATPYKIKHVNWWKILKGYLFKENTLNFVSPIYIIYMY